MSLPSPSGDLTRRHRMLLLLVITALAALARIFYLGTKSLWLDEVATWTLVQQPWDAFVRQLLDREGNMALYHLLLRPWMYFGESEFWTRALSVPPAVATVPVVYAIGRKVWGERAGLLAALLLALNACHVAYSQEARSYIWLCFTSVVSTWYFLEAVERPHWRIWTAWAVANAAGVYFHFLGVLVPLSQGLSLVFLHRRQIPWAHVVGGGVLFGTLAAPAAWYVITHDQGQIDWVPRPNLLSLFYLASFFVSNGGTALKYFLALAYVAGLWLALRALAFAMRRDGWTNQNWRQALIVCSVAGPIAITLVASIAKPIFYNRYLFTCLPPLLMLVAAGLSQLRARTFTAAVAYTVLFSTGTVWSWDERPREPWREVAAYVYAEARAGDALLFHVPWAVDPFEFYRRRMQARPGSDVVNVEVLPGLPNAASATAPRVWIVLFHNQLPDGRPDASTVALTDSLSEAYATVESRRFDNIDIDLYSGPRKAGAAAQFTR